MQDKKRTLKSNLSIGISATILLVASVAVGIGAAKNLTNSRQGDNQIARNVNNSPEIPLSINNSESSSVVIQTASAKEITGEVFQQLTGLSPKSSTYIRFPNVTATNNTNKIIKALVLVIEDRRSNEHDGLLMTDLRIEPAGSLSVDAIDWAKPRKNMMKKYLETGGEVKEDKRDPSISSEEFWLSGSIRDFSISIGMVEFADGTRWMTGR